MRSLEDRCFLKIAKNPDQSLEATRVQRALFSKRARQLVRRSTEMGAAVGGKGTVDTVRLRQTIINKLIDEGRGMAGSFPAPPAFLDDSFTSISLVNSKVGDSFIQDTLSMRCPMLRSIDMTGCFYVRDESIGVLLRRTPMVERFSIRNCRKLTDETLRHIVKHGKNIVALDIGGCFNMTAKGVDSFFKLHPNSPSLTELDISGISVTTQTLEILCKHCRSLEVLRMGFIEYMEDTLMQTLRPLVGNLRSIHVHWNTCITDGFLVWLAKSLPGLEDLNLCGCSHVSVDGVSDMLYDRQEALENDPSGKLSVIKKVNVRYATISKQDIEALEATFQGTKFG